MYCSFCKKELTIRHKKIHVEYWDIFDDVLCIKCAPYAIKRSRGKKDAKLCLSLFDYPKWIIDMRKRHFFQKWRKVANQLTRG